MDDIAPAAKLARRWGRGAWRAGGWSGAALGCLMIQACLHRPYMYQRMINVDQPGSASCRALRRSARTDGWSAATGRPAVDPYVTVLAVDELWIFPTTAHWMSSRTNLTLAVTRPRSWSVMVDCPGAPRWQELATRTCSVGGRRFGVVDPSAARGLAGGTSERCELRITYELRRQTEQHAEYVLLREGVRAAVVDGAREGGE